MKGADPAGTGRCVHRYEHVHPTLAPGRARRRRAAAPATRFPATSTLLRKPNSHHPAPRNPHSRAPTTGLASGRLAGAVRMDARLVTLRVAAGLTSLPAAADPPPDVFIYWGKHGVQAVWEGRGAMGRVVVGLPRTRVFCVEARKDEFFSLSTCQAGDTTASRSTPMRSRAAASLTP